MAGAFRSLERAGRYFLRLPREGAGADCTGIGAGRDPPGDAVLGPRDDAPIEPPPQP
jgi:hypothetical protein